MKAAFTAILSIITCCAFAQSEISALPKLSPRTKMYLYDLKNTAGKTGIQKDYVYSNTAAGTYMSAVIKVTTVNEATLNNLGIKVNTKAGNIWTVMIPLDKVEAFTQTTGIAYIELDEPVCMAMDSVRKATRVDSVHQGAAPLPMPYTGKGVVLGIIDHGFDYTHPSLYDTLHNTYRIKRIWEEKKNGTAPSGFAYGNELTDSNAMRAALYDTRHSSHGAHVFGIAGGSGIGGDNKSAKFRGIAYESEVVFVGIEPDSTQWQSTGVSNIIDGVNYIFNYAQAQGKPCVVNLSWGSPVGPHDGSSLFSQALDNLTGTGKIYVCSAGNIGNTDIHLQKAFSATDTTISTFVNFASYLDGDKATWMDMWGTPGQTFCLDFTLYKGTAGASTGFVCLDDQVHRFKLVGSDGDSIIATITTTTSEFNNKPRAYVSLYGNTKDTACLTIRSTSGELHVWNSYVRDGGGYYGPLTDNGRPWAVDGNTDYTTTDLVSTNTAISVGAFVAKNRYRNLSAPLMNQSVAGTLRKIASFSSRGPTVDGRIRPEIAAPGVCVISAVSAFDSTYLPGGAAYGSVVSVFNDTVHGGRPYYYAQLSGTSMASPAAAGIVALMLQANPQLNPDHVKSILAQTAITDVHTGVLPLEGNNTWGHGKINAFHAVAAAIDYPTGIKNVNTIRNLLLYPNPATDYITLDYISMKDESVAVEIFDINGKRLLNEIWKVSTGLNRKNHNLQQLPAGQYLIQLNSANSNETIKFTVSK